MLVEKASADATKLIEETNAEEGDWKNYLQTNEGLAVEMEPWTLAMKRKLVAYFIRYASVIHKLERGSFEDTEGYITQVLDANRYMEEFVRNNPDIVPSRAAYAGFEV